MKEIYFVSMANSISESVTFNQLAQILPAS